ncbi:hypothetical protein [Methanospirillum lacunae]|uniref:DNA primase n=1 Tax=Methanospirillum lacunae TaxID=668570 RepID=A0A2V2N6U4_9EURY|nr:hypothetical protein [Methanospirillum lacunae]PWR74340.1 hypothetical protein DK846_04110 [Methanospirillum lacunae]
MPEEIQVKEIITSLHLLSQHDGIFEIRIIRDDGICSGYFSDREKAATEILKYDADSKVSGIYVTLNDVDPALLVRRANRIKFRLGKKDASTGDSDIIRRRWLPIDIDPRRPSGVSSSESEHADAICRADTIAEFLSGLGWPDPIIADSGNGAHLLYRIDLPQNDESKAIVKSVLELLDRRFSDSRCMVDTANFNASRIWKVYGTLSRKGDNLLERPHRRSKILKSIVDPQSSDSLVSEDKLRLLLSSEHPDLCTGPDKEHVLKSDSRIDLGSWLSGHGFSYTEKPYQGGKVFVFDSCPFSSAHTDGAYAIQFENGAIFAGCHHTSCGGGKQRWPELRARFDPPKLDFEARLAKLRSERIRAKMEAEGRLPLSEEEMAQAKALYEASGSSDSSGHGDDGPDEVNESILSRCTGILESADPLSFMLETFASVHEGDQTVAECLIHSFASRSVINSKGLHVSITGESGKGKSHAIETMKSLVPKKFRLEGRLSDKALFYMEDLSAGSVIALDDVSLSDQMQEVLKGVTTSFQKPFPYRTVSKDRKAETYVIPERCVWWIAKVEGPGDDQVFNRMLTCWIDDSEDQDKRVLDRTLSGAEDLPDATSPESEEVLVCRQIWESLSPVWVVIPYARKIRFQSAENRRNPDMLLDLVRTNAALNQRQRETKTIGSVTCVIADRTDFNEAARLFAMLNGETGAQANKLTKRESNLIGILSSMNQYEVTIGDLQHASGLTNSSVGKLLHGYHSYGKTYSGLLDKCPAVSFLDRTVTSGDEGCSTMRRTRVYLWDAALYKAWEKGGSVWLCDDEYQESDDSDGNDPDDMNESSYPAHVNPDVCDTSMSMADVQSRNFVRISGHGDRQRCSVCGKCPTQYKERVAENSKAIQRMLCRSCYKRTVSREVASIITLPGVIDTKNLVKRDVPSGRCQVCNLQPAVWSDPDSRVHVCDQCYKKTISENFDTDSLSPGPP